MPSVPGRYRLYSSRRKMISTKSGSEESRSKGAGENSDSVCIHSDKLECSVETKILQEVTPITA